MTRSGLGGTLMGLLLALCLTGPALAKVEGDTIILGAAISLTGKYSANGAHTQKGYDLAVDRLNAAGGVAVGGKQYKLAVVYYDDESTPARGAQLAERLIQQDGVRFMLGPYSSGLTKAMAPVTEKYGVPMVEANGASISLFQQGYRYLFAVLSTTDEYLKSAVQLAAEVAEDPAKVRVAAAFENDPFSLDVRDGVRADVARLGMTLVIDDKLPPELSDMSATLTKVKALTPDLLLVSGHDKGAALAIRQVDEMQVRVPLLALTHCDSAQIIKKFGAAAEGALCSAQWAAALKYRDDLFGWASDYARDFEETYGYAPPYQAAESSAAVMVFADAFERAQSFDPAAVRDALSATDMETFYGPIRFDETGKNIAKPTILFQVQDGAFRVVAPTDKAEVPLRLDAPVGTGDAGEAPGSLGLLIGFPVLTLDLVLNGLMIGAIFALAAYGMALVWGVLNIINVAQGEFVMLGGFVALAVAGAGLPPLAGVAIAAAALFALGWLLYRLVIFRIVGRDMFISILATFGLSILLQQLSNQVFGADVRTLDTGLGTLVLFGGAVAIAWVKVLAFMLALALGLGLWLFLRAAKLGQAIRATAQNPRAARLVGIETDRVYAATYALNAALCGAAGSLAVMALTIHPYMGLPYTVRSFMIVVVAGLGNLGAVGLAGLGLGAFENVSGFLFGVEYQIAVVFVLMVLVLVWRNIKAQRARSYLK